MRRFLLAVLLPVSMLFHPGALSASSPRAELHLIIVTMDNHTISGPLVSTLREVYDAAATDSRLATLFYLPDSGDSPAVVKLNMPGSNPKMFDSFINALLERDHIPNPSRDVDQIIRLLGQSEYSSYVVDYYICPSLDLESGFMPRLFFALGLDTLPEISVSLKLIHASGDDSEIRGSGLFGHWNICKDYSVETY